MIARRQIAAAEDNVAPELRRGRLLRGNGALAVFGPVKTRPDGRRRRAACRGARPPVRPERDGLALRPCPAIGKFRDRVARRQGRARPARRARSPIGCKNRGRPGPAGQGARAPPRSRRHARSAGAGAPGRRSPSHARSSTMAASNCGLQRVRSKSSMRNRRRPPSLCGDALVHERRIGVAEMEGSVRRGRKAEDGRSGDVIDHGG